MPPRAIHDATAPDGTRIAWTTYGEASGLLVSMRPPQFSHLEHEWTAGASHHEFEHFAASRTVLRFDPRGTGLSQRGVSRQSLEDRVADLEAVLDAAAPGIRRLSLDAISSSALVAIAFAAAHPDRVERLVVQNAFIDGAAWWASPVREALVNIARVDWQLCTETWAWLTFGDEQRQRTLRLAEHIRACIEPGDFLAMVEAERTINLAPLLPALTMPVLVLSHPQFARMAPEEANTSLAAGIPGAKLLTIHNTRERVAAIQAFLAGEHLPSLSDAGVRPPQRPSHGLSPREIEVLRFLAEGCTNREIADRLVVSIRTVDAHVRNILDKTDVPTRAAAVAFAIRAGLLGPG